jgi:predicted enzyme related to lactoylglutathione lyase
MSDMNSKHNRAVWFDIPVADLDRANKFYAAVLGVKVDKVEMEGFRFSVLEHSEGNGGCLVEDKGAISADKGILLYLNADGRIHEAVDLAAANGGVVKEPIHPIGPNGFRAIILDSEGNRVALHSHKNV